MYSPPLSTGYVNHLCLPLQPHSMVVNHSLQPFSKLERDSGHHKALVRHKLCLPLLPGCDLPVFFQVKTYLPRKCQTCIQLSPPLWHSGHFYILVLADAWGLIINSSHKTLGDLGSWSREDYKVSNRRAFTCLCGQVEQCQACFQALLQSQPSQQPGFWLTDQSISQCLILQFECTLGFIFVLMSTPER